MLDEFIQNSMIQNERYVPARLQTAIGLVERLRTEVSLQLDDHLVEKGRSGLKGHETFAALAHQRLGIVAINKTHGRRSSNVQDWGQALLDLLKKRGLANATGDVRDAILNDAQEALAAPLRYLLQQEPLTVRVRNCTAEAVVHEILRQATKRGKVGDVAQYLVGSKLSLRLGIDIPVLGANKGDRKSRSDAKARLGDFEIENTIIEVALGLPDDKHVSQVKSVLTESDKELWIVTRSERVETWNTELKSLGASRHRVFITSVEAFVCQNLSEMGGFSDDGKAAQFHKLFEIYNSRWNDQLGTPGTKIEAK